jgi:uncharacterized protein (TIGR04255 family)
MSCVILESVRKETPLEKYEVFKNAPIAEAVLEIVVIPAEELKMESLLSFHKPIKERFPTIEQGKEGGGGFKVGAGSASFFKEKPIGYLFRSHQENKVIQARLNGFAFSKLKPYENWESFRSEAKDLWKSYAEMIKPQKISRISMRYINRIELPLPMRDFEEYILTRLQIAPELPQAISQFFIRFEIPNSEIPAMAVIIQTIENVTDENRLPLIFDIDVIRENEYSVGSAEVWDDFEKLHDFKNEIFFSSITDKTKELFR